MRLRTYIKKVGDKELANRLKVTERRVSSWRLGQRSPRPDMARRIEKITNRQVTFKECYD